VGNFSSSFGEFFAELSQKVLYKSINTPSP
jgi:hypothetical protein